MASGTASVGPAAQATGPPALHGAVPTARSHGRPAKMSASSPDGVTATGFILPPRQILEKLTNDNETMVFKRVELGQQKRGVLRKKKQKRWACVFSGSAGGKGGGPGARGLRRRSPEPKETAQSALGPLTQVPLGSSRLETGSHPELVKEPPEWQPVLARGRTGRAHNSGATGRALAGPCRTVGTNEP